MSATAQSHIDFYTTGRFAQYIREHRTVGSSSVTMVHASQPKGDFSDPPLKEITLIQIHKCEEKGHRDLSAGRWSGRFRPSDFDLLPAETPSDIVIDGAHEITTFALPVAPIQAALAEVAPDFTGDFGRLHAKPFRSQRLRRLCLGLWREAATGSVHGDLFADGTLLQIAAELLRLRDGLEAEVETLALSATHLSRLEDFIDGHLDDRIGMQTLADLVGHSAFRFTRAFKAATGMSPHQYVLDRRISVASELLHGGKETLADIAYACGFSSQAHMTTVFRKKLGITPGQYRNDFLT